MKHVIVYSHGFGVKKDDRGLFTDIATRMDSTESKLFDYNSIDEKKNTVTVTPLGEQALKLSAVIALVREEQPEAIIDLVCHSQGCITAALAHNTEEVRNTIFLAPPEILEITDLQKYFNSFPGAKINIEGTSILPRADGSTTIVEAKYWQGLDKVSPVSLYRKLSEKCNLTIVQAIDDTVLGSTDFSMLLDTTTHQLPGDHNFNSAARPTMLDLVETLLVSNTEELL